MAKGGYARDNANYYTAEGRWIVNLATRPMANMPSGAYQWGMLYMFSMGHQLGDSNAAGLQFYSAGGHLYWREAVDGVWSSWSEL